MFVRHEASKASWEPSASGHGSEFAATRIWQATGGLARVRVYRMNGKNAKEVFKGGEFTFLFLLKVDCCSLDFEVSSYKKVVYSSKETDAQRVRLNCANQSILIPFGADARMSLDAKGDNACAEFLFVDMPHDFETEGWPKTGWWPEIKKDASTFQGTKRKRSDV